MDLEEVFTQSPKDFEKKCSRWINEGWHPISFEDDRVSMVWVPLCTDPCFGSTNIFKEAVVYGPDYQPTSYGF
jgi:hypothetical protein